jgi:carbohydrate-binding DOMON domain-containing protein
LRLVIDGDLSHAADVRVGADGHWHARVDTAAFADPAVAHRLVAFAPASGAVSEARTFRVERPWRLLAETTDPVGDDHGPAGTSRYPTDPSWNPRQMDIEAVRVFGAGKALAVEVQLHAITTPWNPPNGFDHVALTLFIDVPGRGPGATVMPLQDAVLPAGLRWDYRLRAHGWSNALYSAAGADATHEGTSVSPGATIQVDAARHTVRFILPGAALGLDDPHGVRILATTWDYDGGYRPITPEGGTSVFGGGQPGDPRVMDSAAVVAVP